MVTGPGPGVPVAADSTRFDVRRERTAYEPLRRLTRVTFGVMGVVFVGFGASLGFLFPPGGPQAIGEPSHGVVLLVGYATIALGILLVGLGLAITPHGPEEIIVSAAGFSLQWPDGKNRTVLWSQLRSPITVGISFAQSVQIEPPARGVEALGIAIARPIAHRDATSGRPPTPPFVGVRPLSWYPISEAAVEAIRKSAADAGLTVAGSDRGTTHAWIIRAGRPPS